MFSRKVAARTTILLLLLSGAVVLPGCKPVALQRTDQSAAVTPSSPVKPETPQDAQQVAPPPNNPTQASQPNEPSKESKGKGADGPVKIDKDPQIPDQAGKLNEASPNDAALMRDNTALRKKQVELTAQLATAQAAIEKSSRIQWLLSSLGLLTSLVAIGLWVKLLFRDRRVWQGKEAELQGDIASQINHLGARIPKAEQPGPSLRGPQFSLPAHGTPKPSKPRIDERPPEPARVAAESVAPPREELLSTPPASPIGMQSASGTSIVEPPGPPAPSSRQPSSPTPTGDPLNDYALAKSLGEEEGEDWFSENYKGLALSCVNLNDHRLGTAALYFESDARGKFLLVEQGGRAIVLPAFGLDFVSGRISLEGVFTYPAETSAGLTLARAAEVERKGDRWTLQESGELRRG